MFTIYRTLGILGGLAISLFLFRRWDLPGIIGKRLRLYAQGVAVAVVLIVGMAAVWLVSVLVHSFVLPSFLSELIEGMVGGFFVALLIGLFQPAVRNKRQAVKRDGETRKKFGISLLGNKGKCDRDRDSKSDIQS